MSNATRRKANRTLYRTAKAGYHSFGYVKLMGRMVSSGKNVVKA
jgi:hypothetical protein